jgi:sulfide dehydrogenase cytochrome subunit
MGIVNCDLAVFIFKYNLIVNGDEHIMMKRYTEYLILTGAVLGLCLANNASAIDVNKVADKCAECHGKGGASTSSDVPIIGGYSVEFLTNNLKSYKNKDRNCPEVEYKSGSNKGKKTDMCQMVKDLNESDIKQVAQYYASKKFIRAKQKFDPALAAKGKEIHQMSCEKCHSEGGTVAKDDAGMPAGQWTPYLKQALEEFKSGKRPIAKKMKLKMDDLNNDDIEALINYYASFK